jgi:hypothetical protein
MLQTLRSVTQDFDFPVTDRNVVSGRFDVGRPLGMRVGKEMPKLAEISIDRGA